MTDHPPEHRDLDKLGKQIEEARRRETKPADNRSPSSLGVAFRFAAEMASALLVGGGLGWLLDWIFGIHFLIVVFFILGAIAGIRNVMRAARELNAEMAARPPAPTVRDDEES